VTWGIGGKQDYQRPWLLAPAMRLGRRRELWESRFSGRSAYDGSGLRWDGGEEGEKVSLGTTEGRQWVGDAEQGKRKAQ